MRSLAELAHRRVGSGVGGRISHSKIVHLLVVLYLVFMPITIIVVFVGGRRVEFSLVLASLLALLWCVDLLRAKTSVGKDEVWSVWFWLFVCVAAVSLLVSPYRQEALVLGAIQIGATSVVLLASMYVGKHVASKPQRFATCMRALVLAVGAVAAIGAWQFVAFNILGTKFMADFSFMNALRWPGAREMLWYDPGFLEVGGLHRVNSIAVEPSHFVEIMGTIAGLALLRTGLMGRDFGRSLSGAVPLWVVVCLFVSYAAALSVIGLVLLAFTVAYLVIVVYRFDLRSLPRILLAGVVTASLGGALIFLSGSAFVDKLKTIPLVFSAMTSGVQTLRSEQLSALSLAANLFVLMKNLGNHLFLGVGPGGHPHSYNAQAPDWIRSQSFYGLQSMDGGSLLIRLLSETGTVGTILFLVGCLVVVLRSRQAIQKALAFHRESSSQPYMVLTFSIGITASCAALVSVYLIRKGVYYDPPLWVAIALTAAVPPLLNKVYQKNYPGDDGPPEQEHPRVRRAPSSGQQSA